jgi:hypothetical protein
MLTTERWQQMAAAKLDDDLLDDEQAEESPEEAQKRVEKEATREKQRQKLLSAISAGKPKTIEERVAWALNIDPKARDSDVALMFSYWEAFESEYRRGGISEEQMYRFTRPTTLTRARARVQNQFHLFEASLRVRARRGTLGEEERQRAIEAAENYPMFDVYADESGKGDDFLIVGSMWILEARQTVRLSQALSNWRDGVGFADELHFNKISRNTLHFFKEAFEIVAAEAAAVSFKYITLERRGHADQQHAIGRMYFHLLLGGVEHENLTGRAPLPRTMQVWKDLEDVGADTLLLADIRQELETAAAARFERKLALEQFHAVSSESNDLIQIADLFTSSMNRLINFAGDSGDKPKDEFARHDRDLTGVSEQQVGAPDLAVRLFL